MRSTFWHLHTGHLSSYGPYGMGILPQANDERSGLHWIKGQSIHKLIRRKILHGCFDIQHSVWFMTVRYFQLWNF